MSGGIARPEPSCNEKSENKSRDPARKGASCKIVTVNDQLAKSSFCGLANIFAHLLCTHLQHWQEV
jgi:hypothetical protein